MSINNKKLIIISGVTGIGKSKIAYNLAKKLNSEIILLDIFQSYKQLNICSNKPSPSYLNSLKYHNHNLFDLDLLVKISEQKDNENYKPLSTQNNNPKPNATYLSSISRKIAMDLTDNNKIPILEGGSVFYIRNFLGGERSRNSELEEKIYEKIFKIAEFIVDKDDNNYRSCGRIQFLIKENFKLECKKNENLDDKSNEKDIGSEQIEKRLGEIMNFHPNDLYRLRKKLAEEMFKYLKNSNHKIFSGNFDNESSANNKIENKVICENGDSLNNLNLINSSKISDSNNNNYFKNNNNKDSTLDLIETDTRFKSQLESERIQVYHFFFSTQKKALAKMLESRCVNMVNSGLIGELNYLIKNDFINESNIYKKSDSNVFINAFGLLDSLDFLLELMKSEIWKRSRFGFYKFDEKSVDEMISKKFNTKRIEKLIYNFLKEFSVKNRQYTRKQIHYFKNKPELICWKNLNFSDLKANEVSSFNSVCDYEEKLISELIQIVNLPYDEYKEYLKSDVNKQNYEQIATFNNDFKNYLPKFECLKAPNNRYAENPFVRKLLKEAVGCINENRKKLEVFWNLKNNENLGFNKENGYYEGKNGLKDKLVEDVLDEESVEVFNLINHLTEKESKSFSYRDLSC